GSAAISTSLARMTFTSVLLFLVSLQGAIGRPRAFRLTDLNEKASNVFGTFLESVEERVKLVMSLIQKELYEFGPFSLDPAERLFSRGGAPLALTPKVFDTLVCLVRNRGRLLSKDEPLKEIWPDTFVEEVNLAVNISILRKTLGENPQDGRFITTVPGHGYRFVAKVREIPLEAGSRHRPMESGDVLAETSEVSQALKGEGVLLDREKPDGAGGALTARPVTGSLKRVAAFFAVAILLSAIGGYAWFLRTRRS